MQFASCETQAIVFWAWMNCKVQFQYLKGFGFKYPTVEHMQHFGKVLAMWFKTFEVQAECSICKTLVVMLLGTRDCYFLVSTRLWSLKLGAIL